MVIALLALALVQAWAQTVLLTALGALLFLLALWPFYFPVFYRLDAAGVEIDYGLWSRRWPWERFQAYVPVTGGVLLTPFRHTHVLERFRSLHLPCPDNLVTVRDALAAHLPCRDTGENAA